MAVSRSDSGPEPKISAVKRSSSATASEQDVDPLVADEAADEPDGQGAGRRLAVRRPEPVDVHPQRQVAPTRRGDPSAGGSGPPRCCTP